MQEVIPTTSQQQSVLNFIQKFITEHGFSPTLKDIAKFLGTTNQSTAQYFVNTLVEKGFLTRAPGRARAITPTTLRRTIPLLGIIAAGKPIDPIENPEPIDIPSSVEIDERFPHYALKVRGDSMIDMGILDGDIAIIKHQLTANDKDVVVAITENGATLKVLHKTAKATYLEPKNKDYPNIYPTHLEIRGRFIGLIRSGA